jgi:hypothetical protein
MEAGLSAAELPGVAMVALGALVAIWPRILDRARAADPIDRFSKHD